MDYKALNKHMILTPGNGICWAEVTAVPLDGILWIKIENLVLSHRDMQDSMKQPI